MIGIIAVLLAILLPALQKARVHARAIQCALNMRQIGIAATMYMTESKQRLAIRDDYQIDPPGADTPGNSYGFAQYAGWFDALAPNFGADGFAMSMEARRLNNTSEAFKAKARVLWCPEDVKFDGTYPYYVSSYGVPGSVTTEFREDLPAQGDAMTSAHGFNFNRLRNASAVVFLAESGHGLEWYHNYAFAYEGNLRLAARCRRRPVAPQLAPQLPVLRRPRRVAARAPLAPLLRQLRLVPGRHDLGRRRRSPGSKR